MSSDAAAVDVAVVGGGFSGTMAAAHLLRLGGAGLSVALVERSGAAGYGAAYGTRDRSHLLNVPASNMSAYPDKPGHFLDWARAQAARFPWYDAAGVAPGTFAPRMIYGAYVADCLDEAARTSPVRFLRLSGEVTALETLATGARLALRGGQTLAARQVVLALGNAQPRLPLPEGDPFRRSRRCIVSPWSGDGLGRIGKKDRVLLIGAGLTMADVVVSLERRGHEGPLRALSRHGLLPQPHRSAAPRPAFLDPERAPKSARLLMRALREEVERASGAGNDWRSVFDSLRPLLQPLWRALPAAEKARFLRHVRPYWDTHRHRLPRETFELLERLQRSGRLRLHAARLAGLSEKSGEVAVSIRPRGKARRLSFSVDWVVNCTGPEVDLRRAGQPLIDSLLGQGLVRVDELALGLDATPEGRLLDAAGRPSPFLSTLGPALRGLLWETTAVPELRAQALALTRRLLEELDDLPPAQRRSLQDLPAR